MQWPGRSPRQFQLSGTDPGVVGGGGGGGHSDLGLYIYMCVKPTFLEVWEA